MPDVWAQPGPARHHGEDRMSEVEREGDGFVVDAALLAAAFGRSVTQVRAFMTNGRITTRSETGTDADAGRWRLTFYHDGRAFRLTVDAQGNILSRATFDARDPRPSAAP